MAAAGGSGQVAPPAERPPAQAAAARVGLALVIGNSKYAQAELPSVAVDRTSMATALTSLGFRVRELENLQRPRDFEEELRAFLKDEDAAPEDTLVVYYSGHGLQIEGRAYLLGTGITGSGDMTASLREYAADVDNIVRVMEQSAPAARVLIVDACRNNAFAVTPRKAGTAFQRGIEDTYILFADEPGKTVPARSEASQQSPFTAGLLFAFENSDSGLERRFEIAREKTRELNPDQNPQLLKSDPSANRDRAFLDHGGRSAPSRSAGLLLNEAEDLYRAHSWNAFRAKIGAARVLSSEPDLTARLDRELQFSDLIQQAAAAESDPVGARWAAAAAAYEEASGLFTRPWVIEKAALAWLLADRAKEAMGALARLQTESGQLPADRTQRLLKSLASAFPDLAPLTSSGPIPRGGPPRTEFERYVPK
jgi:hypothetical protein